MHNFEINKNQANKGSLPLLTLRRLKLVQQRSKMVVQRLMP
jgi:hypothetical protein